MRIVYMGTPDFAVSALEAIFGAGYEVAAVVTQPDKPKGRGNKMQFPPVKEKAVELGLPVLQPARVRDPAFTAALKELAPDAIIVSAFGQIIPKEILEMPKYGCINIHASLLPKYRGAAPIQWAVIDGEEVSGVTIMRMDEGLDTGDILNAREIPLAADETGGSLFDRLARLGGELLLETLPLLEAGEIRPVKQPAESPTPYARMITKADSRIDWTMSAGALERRIRGLSPWPGSSCVCRGKTLKIWRAEVPEEERTLPEGCAEKMEESTLPAGCVAKIDKDSFSVQCGTGILRILELQAEGKKRMAAGDFLRGFPLKEGESLASE